MIVHDSNKKPEKDQYKQFVKLLRLHEKKIYGHILFLVPNHNIAEDIMQETIVVMLRKFSDYKEGSNFSAWGITIGRFLIKEYYRKKSHSIVHFSSEAMENISESAAEVFDAYDDRTEALQRCLKKLPEDAAGIMKLRYQQNLTIREVAEQFGKSIHSIYKQVSKIHFLLQRCIERNLSAWRSV